MRPKSGNDLMEKQAVLEKVSGGEKKWHGGLEDKCTIQKAVKSYFLKKIKITRAIIFFPKE